MPVSMYGFDYDEAYRDLENSGLDAGACRLESLSFDQLKAKLSRNGLNVNHYLEASRMKGVGNASGRNSLYADVEEAEEEEKRIGEETSVWYFPQEAQEAFAEQFSYNWAG